MPSVTYNILTFHMPTELLCVSLHSLLNSIPSGSHINIINNGESIDRKRILPYSNEFSGCFTSKDLEKIWELSGQGGDKTIQWKLNIIDNGPNNSSIAATWNKCIHLSDTDWLMISNDDVIWKNGWYEIFQQKAEEGCLLIGCGFSCFLIHKKLIELIGEFEEKLVQAYCEDTDFLLRIIKNRGIRISQEFRKYDFDYALYGYFNHFKRDHPWISEKLDAYWKENNIPRPIPPGPNYEIFKEIWGFADKSPEVDFILSSYQYDWKYK